MPDLRAGLPAPARGDEVGLHAGPRALPWRIEKSFPMPTRPAGPTGLPPQTRIDRSPPHDRVRRTSGQSLDRAPNGLEHQEIRPDRTPLPDGEDPSRTTDLHRRPPATRRPPPRPRQDQFTLRCALNCPKSGLDRWDGSPLRSLLKKSRDVRGLKVITYDHRIRAFSNWL
jgi:hypothetical protein